MLRKDVFKIIDVHAHIGGDQRFLMRVDAKNFIDTMNKFNIEFSFVSSLTSLYTDFSIGNRELLKIVKRYSEKIMGLVAVNPYYGNEAVKELRKYVLKYGFRGVKLHPTYFKISMLDKLTIRIVKEAVKINVPLMIHSYDGGIEVSRLAEKFPDALIIMYHMGGLNWREGVLRVKNFKNIYAEISSSVCDKGMIEFAVKELGAERILYGSDIPYQDPSVSLGKVLGADISDREKKMILYENAYNLLLKGGWN